MAAFSKKKLGDVLIEEGKITRSQLIEALNYQKGKGMKLGEVLLEIGMVKEEDILDALKKQLGVERVDLANVEIDRKAIKMVPENLCKKHEIIPVGFEGSSIMVAMNDPLNIFALDDVTIATGFNVKILLASRNEILEAIRKSYAEQYVTNAAEELSKEKKTDNRSGQADDGEGEDVKNAPVVKMVDSLIKNAVESGTSDIHVEPYEKYIRIRYRIDGILREMSRLEVETHPALIARIKILANLNIAEKRIPQDGRIITKVGDKEVDLRVSILPTVYGEKVVIRLLSRDSYKISKNDMGLEPEQLKLLDKIVRNPHGIVLVTGPTGSGKSTTLYTVLNDLNEEGTNIITVEDPVEYMLEGINQVHVNNKAGLTFPAALRSILRQDPDIIMIGEMRDAETAEIGVRSAITGHLVLSTLHTNDAASSVLRLIDMGLEPYMVATSVVGVIAQRLVRKLCPMCKEAYEASTYEKKLLNLKETDRVTLYRACGCGHCNNLGYKGRRGVYEIMEVTREIKEKILYSKNSDEIKDLAISHGMSTLYMSARKLVLEGATTVDEMLNVSFSD